MKTHQNPTTEATLCPRIHQRIRQTLSGDYQQDLRSQNVARLMEHFQDLGGGYIQTSDLDLARDLLGDNWEYKHRRSTDGYHVFELSGREGSEQRILFDMTAEQVQLVSSCRIGERWESETIEISSQGRVRKLQSFVPAIASGQELPDLELPLCG